MRVQATVDRIEGGVAVLILHNGEPAAVTLPSAVLPEGCREGDIVTLSLEPDPGATSAERTRISEKIERLRRR